MWRKITIEERGYIVRFSNVENSYEIIVSNFSKIWIECLNEEELLERCKEMNQLLEAKPEVMIKQVTKLVEFKNDVKVELTNEDSQLTLNLFTKLKGIIFKFKFVLHLGSPETFCKKITFPLIQIIEELQAREKSLCEELKKKDEEINEYKMEGAEISRKNIITRPFNEEHFLENYTKHGRKRATTSLNCLYTFFEKSCGDIYEQCSNRQLDLEVALTPKKESNLQEKTEASRKPGTSRRNIFKGFQYDDETQDDDETYFSKHERERKLRIPQKPSSPKKKRIKDTLHNL